MNEGSVWAHPQTDQDEAKSIAVTRPVKLDLIEKSVEYLGQGQRTWMSPCQLRSSHWTSAKYTETGKEEHPAQAATRTQVWSDTVLHHPSQKL